MRQRGRSVLRISMRVLCIRQVYYALVNIPLGVFQAQIKMLGFLTGPVLYIRTSINYHRSPFFSRTHYPYWYLLHVNARTYTSA